MGWLWGDSSTAQETNISDSFGSSGSGGNVGGDSFGPSFGSDSNYSSFSSPSSSSSGFGMDSGSSSLGGLSEDSASGDAELQKFLQVEQQKAQMQATIATLNNLCFDICASSSASEARFSARTETCLTNCAGRFVDSALFLANRFAHRLSKSGAAGF